MTSAQSAQRLKALEGAAFLRLHGANAQAIVKGNLLCIQVLGKAGREYLPCCHLAARAWLHSHITESA